MTANNRIFRLILAAAMASLLAGCELPPQESQQQGFRGTGMVAVSSPETEAAKAAENTVPVALPPAPDVGPLAGDVYQNVQVLGDLNVAQFTRLMTALTSWVAPEQGCTYCHGDNLADDSMYTKVVARRMIQMTQYINSQAGHVGETGVTCYTCHRGKNVPDYIWFNAEDTDGGMVGARHGQNMPADAVGLTSLPADPFTALLEGDGNIRVATRAALPADNPADIKSTEQTYGLMMHFSQSLGVNCTHCHNSRSFYDWEQSPPTRVTAWHGIQMVRSLNQDYLVPLQDTYPDNRLGVTGDAPKAYCATCHQGVNKPLYGAQMLKDYPSLGGS